MLLSKKLNQTVKSKVLRKLLVADLLDVVVEAVVEDAVLEDLVGKDFLAQALVLEVLSQALSAKLKLIKVEAVLKAFFCKDGLWKALC